MADFEEQLSDEEKLSVGDPALFLHARTCERLFLSHAPTLCYRATASHGLF